MSIRNSECLLKTARPWQLLVWCGALLTLMVACEDRTAGSQAVGAAAPPPEERGRDLGERDKKLLEAIDALPLLDRTMTLVEKKYYDANRVKPRKMMVSGVDALQTRLAEVVAEFDAPLDATPGAVTLRVNTAQRRFDLTKASDLNGLRVVSADIMGFVRESMKEDLEEPKDLEYALVNGMLDTLDPHSVLLTPKIYEDMQTSHGGFGGLGIVIGVRGEGQLTVINPIEGTPASRAGLKKGDTILRIGEESTVNMSLNEAVDRLRGEVGTSVDLMVGRESWKKPRKFTITREHIKIRSLVHHALKDDGIAYIRIKSFEKNTGDDVHEKLDAMRAEMGGEIKGLILDLRYNAGGLLSQAIEVGDAFLDDGVIVASEGAGGTARDETRAVTAGTEPKYPIVVLVNPGSASASEIVAGALKNHDRALLVGDTTFGKGSVQILKNLKDGSALKLTIAQYLTPGDISIQGVGIAPDIRVVPVLVSEDGIDLFTSENIRREGTLNEVLVSEHQTAKDRPSELVKYLMDPEEDDPDAIDSDDEFKEDFEIRLARELLKATKAWERPKFLENTLPALRRVEEAEMDEIAKKLSKRGVDWTLEGTAESQPFEVTMELSREQPIPAGEPFEVKAVVKNTGTKPIQRLYAVSSSNSGLLDDREFMFGRIEPGKSRYWTLTLRPAVGHETRVDEMLLHFGDATGKLEQVASVDIAVKARAWPHFAFSYQIDDSKKGNGDGLLQAGEEVTLRVLVKNVGEGASEESVVYIRNASGSAMFLSKGREPLGAVEPGAFGTAELNFRVNGAKKDSTNLEFDLAIYDKAFDTRVEESVTLPVHTDAPLLNSAKGRVLLKSDSPILAGASTQSPRLAMASKGAILERLAQSADGALTRVQFEGIKGEMTGWVASSAVELTDASPAKDGPGVTLEPSRSAPRIVFNTLEPLQKSDSVEITGTITDDGSVANYYVYLLQRDGRRTNSVKLDYGVGSGPTKPFRVTVPLDHGLNRVTVVARDDLKLEHSADIYLTSLAGARE